MALPTISTYPSSVRVNEEITITGTNFSGADILTGVFFNYELVTEVAAEYFIVESGTSVRVKVPTVFGFDSNGQASVLISLVNGTGSVDAAGETIVNLITISSFITKSEHATGTFDIEVLQNSGSFLTKPLSAVGTFDIEDLVNSGSFITKTFNGTGVFAYEAIRASGVFITDVISGSGTFTVIAADASFLGDISFSVNPSCTTLTITDTTDYAGNSEVRSTFSLSINVRDLRTGSLVTATPDNVDDQLVSYWTVPLNYDTIYSVFLYNDPDVIRDEDHFLFMCGANAKRNRIERNYLDLMNCQDCSDFLFDEYLMITGLHDGAVGSFRAEEYQLALSLLDDIEYEYSDYITEKEQDFN